MGLIVDALRRRHVLLAIRSRQQTIQVENQTDLPLVPTLPKHLHRLAVRKQEVMCRLVRLRIVAYAGGVQSVGVPEERAHPGLVMRGPELYAVSETVEDDTGILGKVLGGVARGPSAQVLQAPAEDPNERE